jgi:uncharacterized delta-60 repeat protein
MPQWFGEDKIGKISIVNPDLLRVDSSFVRIGAKAYSAEILYLDNITKGAGGFDPLVFGSSVPESSFDLKSLLSVDNILFLNDGTTLLVAEYLKSNLVKINSDFSVNFTFTNNCIDKFKKTNELKCVADSNNNIFVWNFDSYNNLFYRLIKLNSDGSEDTNFSINAIYENGSYKFIGSISGVSPQNDGKVVVVGNFINYLNISGNSRIVRLNFDGTLDTSFSENTKNLFSSVTSINVLVQSNGKILVYGLFNYKGVSRSIIRLNSDGSEDIDFNTNTSNIITLYYVKKIKITNDGKIVLLDNFGIKKLQNDGAVDSSFESILKSIQDFDIFSNNKIFLFTSTDATIISAGSTSSTVCTRVGFARRCVTNTRFSYLLLKECFQEIYEENGELEKSKRIELRILSPNFNNSNLLKKTIISPSDSLYLIGPLYTNYFFGILDSNLDSLENNLYTQQDYNDIINNITYTEDNKLIIAGKFTNYKNQINVSRLIKLNEDRSLDENFISNAVTDGSTPYFNNEVLSLANIGNSILVAGLFTNYKNQSGNSYLLKFNSDGTEDTLFSQNILSKFNNSINVILVQKDNKILVGGNFSSYNGNTSDRYLIRLNEDGTPDEAFNLNIRSKFNAYVKCMAIQKDGKILVGGNFNSFRSSSINKLIRLNEDGTEDISFTEKAVVRNGVAGFSDVINSISLQSDGKIIIGGEFTNYSGQTGKSYLVRLFEDGREDFIFSEKVVTEKINNKVLNVEVEFNDNIIISGNFTNYNSPGLSYIFRLSKNGDIDNYFSNNFVIDKVNNPVNYTKSNNRGILSSIDGAYADGSVTYPYLFQIGISFSSKFYNLFYVVDDQNLKIIASDLEAPTGYSTFKKIGVVYTEEDPLSESKQFNKFKSLGQNYLLDQYLDDIGDTNELIVKRVATFQASNWSNIFLPNFSWKSLAFGNNTFITIGSRLAYSSYANVWTLKSLNQSYNSICFGINNFVAVSNTGSKRVLTTVNGAFFTQIEVPLESWSAVTFGNGYFLALSEDGKIMISVTGSANTWIPYDTGLNKTWKSVTYGKGIFVAVGSSGDDSRVMTSPNGVIWTLRESPLNNWTSVTYGGDGKFVAVASSGNRNRIMVSEDGVAWQSKDNQVDNNFTSITYGNGIFVAVSSNGTNRIITSSDGSDWKIKSSPVENNWTSINFGNGVFSVVADSGSSSLVSLFSR